MECPKCKANNSDDAVFCSLCYENFKPKAKDPAASSSSLAAFPEVSSVVEDFIITGPLMIREEGLYFFMKACQRREDNRAGTMIGNQMGGIVGHLIGAGINAAVDKACDSPLYRPEKFHYRLTEDIIESCQKALADAPDIPSCREFFVLDKKDIVSLEFGFFGGLTLKANYLKMEISGIDPREKASGYFALRGYPIKR